MTNTQYRQGDVLIQRIAELPGNLIVVSRENGRVVLAHGEVTGHAHAFCEEASEKFNDSDGREFFRVGGTQLHEKLPVLRQWREQVMVEHPEHGVLEFAMCDVTIKGRFVIIDGEFGLLRHDEHTIQGIPAGLYSGGVGGKVRQREYSPARIQNVAD